MRPLPVVLALTVGMVLAGCQPSAAVHDKSYYAAHPDVRALVLANCRNDPGGLGETPNCVNAIQADADAEHQRVFHGPPPPATGVSSPDHL
jgi:hypothetical protein